MRIRALSVLIAAAALGAGCGGTTPKANGVASESAKAIVAATRSAAAAATAVHVVGSAVNTGIPYHLDLSFDGDAQTQGRIGERALSFDLIRSGGTIYLRGSNAFYTGLVGAREAALLDGKWLAFPVSSKRVASLRATTDMHALLRTLLAFPGLLKKGAAKTVDGTRAVPVSDTIHGGTVYVATTGPPYPVEVVASQGTRTTTVTFDHWNHASTITAPTNVVDVGG